MWTVYIDGEPDRFPFYRTRAAARRAASTFRGHWPNHAYRVLKIAECPVGAIIRRPRPSSSRSRLRWNSEIKIRSP
jgi:hypothetical protein